MEVAFQGFSKQTRMHPVVKGGHGTRLRYESNRLWGLSRAMMGTQSSGGPQTPSFVITPASLDRIGGFLGIGILCPFPVAIRGALKAAMTAAVATTTTVATKSTNKRLAPPQDKKAFKVDDDNADSTDCSSVDFVDDVSVRVVVAIASQRYRNKTVASRFTREKDNRKKTT